MAVESSLKIKMGTLSGVKTFTFKYIKQTVTTAQVKALAQALITNGSVYRYPPQTLQGAELVQTDTTEFDIS